MCELGATCDELDIEDDVKQVLSDEEVWLSVLSKCEEGRYDGANIMPTCGTFSAARHGPTGGPQGGVAILAPSQMGGFCGGGRGVGDLHPSLHWGERSGGSVSSSWTQ